MSEFLTPRLLISEYYDSLINQLDIYTEERINECEEKDHQYKLNDLRQKEIDKIRKLQDENLKFYNDNKEKFKIDRTTNLAEEKLEELKCQLFANRFCYLFESTDKEIESLFKLRTVITDFYLRESDIDYIRDKCEYYKKPYEKRFDQRFFVAYQLAKYLKDGHSNGVDIINVKKNSLFDVRDIDIDFDRKFDEFDFLFDIHFSALEILYINLNYERISDFSAFANLEYLSISRVDLYERPFENLHKLFSLKIDSCDLSEFDFDSLNSLTSLKYIDISRNYINRQCSLKIDLNQLINLRRLELNLNGNFNLELILTTFNKLNTLKMVQRTIDFSVQFNFPEMECLQIRYVDLSKHLSQQSFDGMSSLVELNLISTNLTNVNFIYTDSLAKLKNLILRSNEISMLGKSAFSKLKSLKSLNLSDNKIEKLLPGTFDGLDCLEELNISDNYIEDIRSIDKAVFDGLKRLEKLYIKDYDISNDDIKHLEREGLIIS